MAIDPRERVIEEARAFVNWARAATAHGQRYPISANDVLRLAEAVDACEGNDAAWFEAAEAFRVRVSVLSSAASIRGRVGWAWPDPVERDLKQWALVVDGDPRLRHVHPHILKAIPYQEPVVSPVNRWPNRPKQARPQG